MKTNILVFGLALLVGCASAVKYATEDQKILVVVKESNFSAGENYDKALQFFAENLNSSNSAIQIKDKEKFHIVSNLLFDCKFQNSFGGFGNVPVNFTVDFQAKEKKTRIQIKAQNAIYLFGAYRNEGDIAESQVENLKNCQKEFIAQVDKYLEQKKTDW